MSKYFKFRADLFSINYNSEQSGTIISEDDTSMSIDGIFRTAGDFGAIIWSSEDYIKNQYIAYKTDVDYSNVKLSFEAKFQGFVIPYNDLSQPALTINHTNGEVSYITLGFCSSTSIGNSSMRWTGVNGVLGQKWIKWNSIKATWYKDGKQGECIEDRDYKVDYVKGLVYVCGGNKVPYDAEVKLQFEYSDFKTYVIDFDNLYEGLNPKLAKKINVDNIKDIRFPLIPQNYNKGKGLIANQIEREYNVLFNNINVTNGDLNDEKPYLAINGYSIAEDYDNIYSYCPRRMAKEMNKLGYSQIVDLYIGASHFYCKNGQANQIVNNYKDMTLDQSKGLNQTFKSWLSSYCKHLKNNNVNEIIISVSLENLQMPDSWKQRLFDGTAGQTGWQPPTCFYSLTNSEVRTYIEKISTECLNIVDQYGLDKTFQFGEPWWWAQAFAPGNVSQVIPTQPLAIYDEATKIKFKIDNGFELPVYKTSTFKMDNQSKLVANWLNLQLQDYSNFMKNIAMKNGAKFAVLYYPPSTLSETVPEFVKSVNTPFNAWNDNQLDYLQLEDYEWVTSNNPQHQEAYTFGQKALGYSPDKQQYFAGFVDNPSKASIEWPLIWKAAKEAKEKGFANVFIWSGTQVRDGDIVETDAANGGETPSEIYSNIIKEFGFTEKNKLGNDYVKVISIANGQFELGIAASTVSTDKGILNNLVRILDGQPVAFNTNIEALSIPFGKKTLSNVLADLNNGLIGIEITDTTMSISLTKIENYSRINSTLRIDLYLVEEGILTVSNSWAGVIDIYKKRIIPNYTLAEKVEILGMGVCGIILAVAMIGSFGVGGAAVALAATTEGALEETTENGIEETTEEAFGGSGANLTEEIDEVIKAKELNKIEATKFASQFQKFLEEGKLLGQNGTNLPSKYSRAMDMTNPERYGNGFSDIERRNPTIDNINATLRDDFNSNNKAAYIAQSKETLTIDYLNQEMENSGFYKVNEGINEITNEFKSSIREEYEKFIAMVQESINTANKESRNGDPSRYSWNVENCAEIWAVRNALLVGAKLENLVVRTLQVPRAQFLIIVPAEEWKYAEPCDNCEETFKEFLINFSE